MTPARPSDSRALALRYDRSLAADEMSVPQVVAKGRGFAAERILELARTHGVPVRQDRDLVEMLSACELGEAIPEDVYAAVAELLAWLYRCNRSLAQPTGEDGSSTDSAIAVDGERAA
jgi:flagellar biosynthesis protein